MPGGTFCDDLRARDLVPEEPDVALAVTDELPPPLPGLTTESTGAQVYNPTHVRAEPAKPVDRDLILRQTALPFGLLAALHSRCTLYGLSPANVLRDGIFRLLDRLPPNPEMARRFRNKWKEAASKKRQTAHDFNPYAWEPPAS